MTQTKRILIAAAVLLLLGAAARIAVKRADRRVMPVAGADTEATLLLRYSERTVATVGGDRYRTYALYRNADNSYTLRFTSVGEERSWSVPEQAALDAYALIRRYGIEKWNDRRYGPGPDGRITSLDFLSGDGTPVHVSSDRMPDNGEALMGAVADAMTAYCDRDA